MFPRNRFLDGVRGSCWTIGTIHEGVLGIAARAGILTMSNGREGVRRDIDPCKSGRRDTRSAARSQDPEDAAHELAEMQGGEFDVVA
jgi:hypothetical protein